MVLKIDYLDGSVLEWHATPTGVQVVENEGYTPTIYVNSGTSKLTALSEALMPRSDVVSTGRERWRPAFRREPETVLRIDVSSIDRVRPLAGWIRRRDRPGTYRLFNIDFSREFRYCLDRDLKPTPQRELRSCTLSYPHHERPAAPITRLTIDGETVKGRSATVVNALRETLDRKDPDVLVLSTAALVSALVDTAERLDSELQLGRRPGYEQLAGRSTYESYGQVGHSPARYNVPGRAIVDLSNTFFYRETNLDGCLDLAARSYKPLQELSWASIGNVLTAIQIREAIERDVLVPWKSWRHEFPKRLGQLHEADRGGFTFSPEVGVHENVHELDFSSLYPNIICTRNISPETIRCDCHDREDVPGLGYSICDDDGYLPEVLQPIIDDRDRLKAEIAEADDSTNAMATDGTTSATATDETTKVTALQGQADALKWILVSCFGYQGFSNAKFGRIECHEAINAFARELLLDAKAQLERAGWRVVHGIVDSLWVTAQADSPHTPLETVAAEITEQTGVRLEYEADYDWLAFVPRRDSESGALTRYFGKRCDGSYKHRGVECRQRSTPAYVSACQQSLIETFDESRDPEVVCADLSKWIARLESGDVEVSRLELTNRASRPLEEYTQASRTTAALRRQRDEGERSFAGEDVTYVVVDDGKQGCARVRFPHEDDAGYDSDFYREQLLRAAESVLSPLGWRAADIEEAISDGTTLSLESFG